MLGWGRAVVGDLIDTYEERARRSVTTADQVVVLLAAGSGSRFTGTHHKLLGELPEQPGERSSTVFGRALHHALASGVGPVVVVTGAIDAALLAADSATAELLADDAVIVRANPRWSDGQATSVHVGLDAAREFGATVAIVGLADQPFITPAAWRTVAAGSAPITVATYGGRRGNPVRLHADVWDLVAHEGDEGARALMRSRPDLVIEVPCTGSLADIDTVEDLHRWQSN